jgi:gliding motility-associated-like protein
MNPYILKEHKISSCDSVTWGHIIVKRPPDKEGDYTETVDSVFRVEYPPNYCCDCDTLKSLKVTIIDPDTVNFSFIFDQQAFCNGDDMGGSIELETNFTAFDWKFEDVDKDSLWTEFVKSIEIEYSGWYYVHAYMDTSLYDTLKDLRIVNCFFEDKILVEDCDLIIPNVITPNGDGTNDVLGIKKLNPKRENELTISDRWGKTVFHQKNYKCVFKAQKYENDEDAFAGISNWGQPLPDGTYYYAFKYAAIKKKKKYTGTIVILR